jgi:hypothetical protein
VINLVRLDRLFIKNATASADQTAFVGRHRSAKKLRRCISSRRSFDGGMIY